MNREAPFSAQYLRRVLSYSAEDGSFTWLDPQGVRANDASRMIGEPAGGLNSQGHRYVRIEGASYIASRLAWYHQTGVWPSTAKVHFKDNDRTNLRFSNLQLGRGRHSGSQSPFAWDYLRNILHYDADTGLMLRIGEDRARPAGYRSSCGRVMLITIDGHVHPANRVVWFYETKKWPLHQVLHANGDLFDLRFENLFSPDSIRSRRPLLDQVRTLLDFDPESGTFTYLSSGERADKLKTAKGATVNIGEEWPADQLGWYLQTGEWLDEVFHLNQDPWDNTFANLSSISSSSAPGRSIPGVEWKPSRHKWQARLVDGDGHTFTQRFAEFDQALEARQSAERRFGEVVEPRPKKAKKLKPIESDQKTPEKKRDPKLASPHPGVTWNTHCKAWHAYYYTKGSYRVGLGYFERVEDAISARKAAELTPEYTANKVGRPRKDQSIANCDEP